MENHTQKIINKLIKLKQNTPVLAVKAEFEAEGALFNEVISLKKMVSEAELDLVVKIGGCEALKDIYECSIIKPSAIVAPMIESEFALKKFFSAINNVFSASNDMPELFINIESITSYNSLDSILSTENAAKLTGIVVGRGDLAESLGYKRSQVNDKKVFEITLDILLKAKKLGLKCGIGGEISGESLDFLKKLPPGSFDFIETRKVLIKNTQDLFNRAAEYIAQSLEFEILWLESKREFSGVFYTDDIRRLAALKSKYNSLMVRK